MRTTMKRVIPAVAVFLIAAVVFSGTPYPPQGRIFNTATAPDNGVDTTQTLTFGGTITGGTFILQVSNRQTGPIPWSSTNATLVSNINSALQALATIGTGGVYVAPRVMTSGVGTITVTFIGKNAKLVVPLMTRFSSLTGSAPTLTIAVTTTGVTADGRNSDAGTYCIAQDTGRAYVNLGTPPNPSWMPTSFIASPTPSSTPTPTPTPNG